VKPKEMLSQLSIFLSSEIKKTLKIYCILEIIVRVRGSVHPLKLSQTSTYYYIYLII